MPIEADTLSPGLWDAILQRFGRNPAEYIAIGRVIKRDDVKKLIWLNEFPGIPIPLVGLHLGFSYYDTQASGTVTKRQDLKGEGMNVITPKLGRAVVVIKPFGNLRFPLCVGEILSTDYWGD